MEKKFLKQKIKFLLCIIKLINCFFLLNIIIFIFMIKMIKYFYKNIEIVNLYKLSNKFMFLLYNVG